MRYAPDVVTETTVGTQPVLPTHYTLPPTRWTLKHIRATFDFLADYTLSGISQLLKRLSIRLRQGRPQQYSPDPNYTAKEGWLLSVLDEASANSGKIVVIFLDEFTYYHWPVPAPDWSEVVPIAKKAPPGNVKRRIVGALDATTGEVSYLQAYAIGNQKFIEFLHQIAQKYYFAEEIYIVLDNWPVHFHKNVIEALESLPKIQLLPLPTYSPWLNPIEKLWDWLKANVIKMHRLAGLWQQLQQNVSAFLDQFAHGSLDLLRRVGLLGDGKLARAILGSYYTDFGS